MNCRAVKERLIVAADFDPAKVGGVEEVEDALMSLISGLKDSGVIIKVNSALRLLGYQIIDTIHEFGLKVFADLKLNDIPETMKIDAACLSEFRPDILTVMASAHSKGVAAVKQAIHPACEVLAVTILTSLKESECRMVYGVDPEVGVMQLAGLARVGGADGLILSPKELPMIVSAEHLKGFSLNTPGIRPKWSIVEGDDQSRVSTPYDAIMAGADRIVVGRPITQADNPFEAVERTLAEIEEALKTKGGLE